MPVESDEDERQCDESCRASKKKTKDLVTSGFRKGIGGFLMADEWTESCLQNS